MKRITIIFLLATITSFNLTAQQTYVPDDNFEQALIDLGYDTGALNNYVPTANIENLTTLNVTSKNIADLTGIEDFTALNMLLCHVNQLTSLDVSENTNLTSLFCQSNQLSSLDVSVNYDLSLLYCYGNQLINLDVKNGNNSNFTSFNATNNPNLTCIFVDDVAYSTTNWTNIDVTSTFVNTQAECDMLTATYVPDDNFEQALIDLGYDTGGLDDYVPTANIENITDLTIASKNIADLTGIENFTALEMLNCNANILTNIDLSNNTALETLHCIFNQQTSIDLSQNSALGVLNCANNLLQDIDISQNLALVILNCSNNLLQNIDVSPNILLNQLRCNDNQLTNLDVRNGNNSNFTSFNASNNPNLTCIFVDDAAYSTTNWTDIDAASTFVETQADCDALNFTYVPDDNFEQALIDLGYDTGTLDDYVPTANIENIILLDVNSKNIADLTGIEGFKALESLYCDANQIINIDVSNNTNLQILYCYTNQLTSIDVSQNLVLRQLTISDNVIENIDISHNTALTLFWCQINQISSLDLTSNSNLLEFRCSDNLLTNLDIRNGGNTNIVDYNSVNNPNLTCIFVDDATYSTTNWTEIDATSTFVATEAECDALSIDNLVNNSFAIYPNPVKDSFTIQTNLDITYIEIYDVFGKLLKTVPASKSVIISELQAGVYFVRINTPQGVGIHKIIKN